MAKEKKVSKKKVVEVEIKEEKLKPVPLEKSTPESKVAEINKEILKVEKSSVDFSVVKTQEDYEKASVFLSSVVKPRVNRINELVKFFTDPFVEARRVALVNKNKVEDMFSSQVATLVQVEANVKKSMTNFLREQEAIARKEEERLAKLRNKQNEKREEKGQAPVVIPLPSVARVDTTIKNVEGGKTTAKKVWKFQIDDVDLLREQIATEIYNIALEKGIVDQYVRKVVSNGVRELAGVRIYEDFDISATAGK